MNSKAKLICGFLSAVLASCQEQEVDFYRDSPEITDVARMPIVKPYQLTSACYSAWYCGPPSMRIGYGADSINYSNKYINFYTSFGQYVVFSTITNQYSLFNSRSEFNAYALKIAVSKKLYLTKMVYENWVKTALLPWGI